MSQVFKEIPVSDLKLDLFNPRLPKSKQDKDEKTVIEYMLLEASTTELMTAIAENDFFAGELLLVIEDTLDIGKYVVVEGNRRLTAVKLLQNPNLTSVKKLAVNDIIGSAKHKPLKLPCLVFEDKNKILKYLGFRHITGIKSWRLLEKARYLSELRERDFSNTSFISASIEIAKMIGSNSAYVKRLLISFDLYKIVEYEEDFYQIDGLNDTKFFLNYFTDSLIKENIRSFLNVDINSELPLQNLNRNNLKKMIGWWFEKFEGQSRVIGDSEGLKYLDRVVGHTLALEAFEKGLPIKESYEMTGDLDIQFEKKIKDSLKSIEQADIMANKVNLFYSDLYEDLKNIRKIAQKINDYKTKLEQDGDEF